MSILDFNREHVAYALAHAAEIAQTDAERRALNKAEYNLWLGLSVVTTANGYLVPSGSRDSVIHRVIVHASPDGDTDFKCSCEAGQSGKGCWHTMLIGALETTQHNEVAA